MFSWVEKMSLRLRDLLDLFMTGDHPEALVLESTDFRRLRIPPHGGRLPEFGELLERHAFRVDVGVREVDSLGECGLCH